MSFPNYPKAENWGVRDGKASYREGRDIDSLVLHAMAGYYEPSMRWANDSTNSSFHYGVSKTGRVGQAVDEQYAAWQAGNWDMNLRSISIEHEDETRAIHGPWFTDAMFNESTKLAAYLCKKYRIPVSRLFLHKDVSVMGTACPGNYFPLQAYKNRVNALISGSTTPAPTPTPTPTKLQWVNFAYHSESTIQMRFCNAAAEALRRVGWSKVGSTSNYVKAINDALDGTAGNHPCVITNRAYNSLPLEIRREFKVDGNWRHPDNFDVWDATGSNVESKQKIRWRIAEVCKRTGLDAIKALDTFENILKSTGVPSTKRGVDDILGAPIYTQEQIKSFMVKKGADKAAIDMVDPIYKYAPRKNLAPDFLAIQMGHETGWGHYGGASRKYNPAGIKLAGNRGDEPSDFEVPETADEGARMLVNHWCAVFNLAPIGTPHARFEEARKVYLGRPRITKISQLGNGNWATDPLYASKLKTHLSEVVGGATTISIKPSNGGNDLDNALKYVSNFYGVPYGWWTDGPVPDKSPAWAVNAPAPSIEEVRRGTIFCAGLSNLMLRRVGKKIPYTSADTRWDGGTLAYGEYYKKVAEKFNPNKKYPRGTLIGRYYRNPSSTQDSRNGQGHVAIILGNGKVFQSYDAGGGKPGVNQLATVAQSHNGWFYEYAVLPKNWLL